MKRKSFYKDEQGVALIFVGIFLVVLLGFTSLAVDMGLVYFQRSKLQTAMDSAALAAAQELPNTANAINTAKEYIEKNGFEVDDENFNIEFLEDNTVVRVSMPYETQALFARVLDVSSILSVKNAAAQKREFPIYPPALDYVMFQGGEYPLKLSGTNIHIYGSVHSNGTFQSSSNVTIEGDLNVCSPVNFSASNSTIKGTIRKDADLLPMPDFTYVLKQAFPWYPNMPTFNTNEQSSAYNYESNIFFFSKYLDGNLQVMETHVHGDLYVNGNAMFQSLLYLNGGTLFVTGDLTINNIVGSGKIIAGGKVMIQNNSDYYPTTFTGEGITIYSNFYNSKSDLSRPPETAISINSGYTGTATLFAQGNISVQGAITVHPASKK